MPKFVTKGQILGTKMVQQIRFEYLNFTNEPHEFT